MIKAARVVIAMLFISSCLAYGYLLFLGKSNNDFPIYLNDYFSDKAENRNNHRAQQIKKYFEDRQFSIIELVDSLRVEPNILGLSKIFFVYAGGVSALAFLLLAWLKPPAIRLAPGTTVLRWTEFLCSPKTYERVFLQGVLDMQDEHFEALSEGRPWKARWIVVRGHFSLLMTAVFFVSLKATVSFVKSIFG